MKLPFEAYNPLWHRDFTDLKIKLCSLLQPLNPQIEHIGSTAVEGLSAKPIIDIQIGVDNEVELNTIPSLLQLPSLVYYEKYNIDMPTRRFFILFNQPTSDMSVKSVIEIDEEVPQILHNHDLRLAHIHAFIKGSPDWIRHIAFRDYLRAHPDVKNAYQALKQKLVEQSWQDGNAYNEAKDSFLKKQEKQALDWFHHEETPLN